MEATKRPMQDQRNTNGVARGPLYGPHVLLAGELLGPAVVGGSGDDNRQFTTCELNHAERHRFRMLAENSELVDELP